MAFTQSLFIINGFWYTAYEPHDMPGAWCRTRYTITPADGGGMLPDGRYKGFVPSENVLRIVRGGEYMNGCVINGQTRDFVIEFDEAYHDEYRAGVERGYRGKRACSCNHFCKRSVAWQDGYREGRQARAQQSVAA